jgi:hypothetical protein
MRLGSGLPPSGLCCNTAFSCSSCVGLARAAGQQRVCSAQQGQQHSSCTQARGAPLEHHPVLKQGVLMRRLHSMPTVPFIYRLLPSLSDANKNACQIEYHCSRWQRVTGPKHRLKNSPLVIGPEAIPFSSDDARMRQEAAGRRGAAACDAFSRIPRSVAAILVPRRSSIRAACGRKTTHAGIRLPGVGQEPFLGEQIKNLEKDVRSSEAPLQQERALSAAPLNVEPVMICQTIELPAQVFGPGPWE